MTSKLEQVDMVYIVVRNKNCHVQRFMDMVLITNGENLRYEVIKNEDPGVYVLKFNNLSQYTSFSDKKNTISLLHLLLAVGYSNI